MCDLFKVSNKSPIFEGPSVSCFHLQISCFFDSFSFSLFFIIWFVFFFSFFYYFFYTRLISTHYSLASFSLLRISFTWRWLQEPKRCFCRSICKIFPFQSKTVNVVFGFRHTPWSSTFVSRQRRSKTSGRTTTTPGTTSSTRRRAACAATAGDLATLTATTVAPPTTVAVTIILATGIRTATTTATAGAGGRLATTRAAITVDTNVLCSVETVGRRTTASLFFPFPISEAWLKAAVNDPTNLERWTASEVFWSVHFFFQVHLFFQVGLVSELFFGKLRICWINRGLLRIVECFFLPTFS